MSTCVTLTVKDGVMAGKEFVFVNRGECLIGRASDCDLRLPGDAEYQTVSRHHCLLEITPEEVRVRDLGSRNGTYINGKRIARFVNRFELRSAYDTPLAEHELKDGDELSVAEVTFRIGIYPPAGSADPLFDLPEERNLMALVGPSLN